MSVIKIERYRAVCDDCGALGDLRDSEALAVKHAMEKQGWFGMATAYGFDRTLCATCARLRQVRKPVHEAEAKAAVLDTLTAKLDALHADDGGRSLEPYTAHHLSTIIAERLAVERAKRGITKETPST